MALNSPLRINKNIFNIFIKKSTIFFLYFGHTFNFGGYLDRKHLHSTAQTYNM